MSTISPISTVPRGSPHASFSDDRLIALARTGDNAAFEQLAERHSGKLRRVLYRITRDCDAAMDAVQEALLRAWRNIGRFEGRSLFTTWLTRIGINEAYRALPRAAELPLELDDQVGERVPAWGAQPDAVFESREFLHAVEVALEDLPPDYASAVRLRDVQGLSTQEAAAALGIGERALKSRLHRGRMVLRSALEGYFEEGYA